ncbi:F-box-like domain-containing protein [Pochonia chlamydosporia 170]|uniref:F-box-like domain-containing protein n=1 Tax=Pochonia chlamydosporia 170 TaxID=1380566 RepID=A0A179F755_METCM|nr:F-box-like domain-containing protein [Pochonia chlamydosporia 170]OAQ61140.1 F-box-like domain-containing protein [Pochonia chlamydosporia 170]
MSFHQLPPEILLHILRSLGSAFFRQDLRRLLVSKWWYELARVVLLQDIHLSAGSLQRLALATNRESVIHSIQDQVITVNLGLDGFENWHSLKLTPTTETSRVDFTVLSLWTSELNSWLATLANILQNCTKLQILRLEARPERHDPRLGLQRRDYLMASPLASLLSIKYLTCLEIDAAGTNLISENNAPSMHICGYINDMLPTLRRLRCRMSSICPQILEAAGKGPLRRLQDVVINLSLSELSVSDTSYRYPSRCVASPGDSFPQLKADMELHAGELVHVMNSPRIVRIVSHTFPGLKMHSFDAITGRQMLLESPAPWDADGEEVEITTGDNDDDDHVFNSDTSSEEFVI